MKKKIIYSLFLSTLLLSACSTALDVNGNYKETMVIYGLLDQSQAKQYIKVNKAFLGQGNAYAYAQIKDSSQYANSLNVKLQKIDGSGSVVAAKTLLPDNTIPKQTGTFYAPDQANAIYSIDSSSLGYGFFSTSYTYKLSVTNTQTGTTATGTTSLISDIGTFTAPSVVGQFFSFVLPNNPDYNFYVNWNSAINARLYQVIIRFNYIDSTLSHPELNDTSYLDYVQPIQSTQGLVGGELFSVYFKGEQYLEFIGNQLSGRAVPNFRRALKTDIILVAGSDDLSTYIQANAPSIGISQDRPIFTDITNGYGLFSSRYNKPPFSKPLSPTTVDSLACGQYTKSLHFLNAHGQLLNCH